MLQSMGSQKSDRTEWLNNNQPPCPTILNTIALHCNCYNKMQIIHVCTTCIQQYKQTNVIKYWQSLAAAAAAKSLSCVWLLATPWTAAYQAPLSMVFSRQQYWSGLPFPSPGDLRNPGIEPRSPALQTDALPSEPPGKPKYSIKAKWC